MFSRILVATDLSEASDCVIGSLGVLRTWGGKEVILVHCLDLCEPSMVKEELKALALPYLRRQAEALEKQGLKTGIEIAQGPPHDEINRITAEQHCSLIVIGSRGKNLSSQILLGGVSSEVVRHARAPVLLVRINLSREKDSEICSVCRMDPARHILFPTDFSAHAETAFNTLKKMVAAGSKEVTLFHVQNRSELDKNLLEDSRQSIREKLSLMQRELDAIAPVRVNVEITDGEPDREILARTQDSIFSLIVLSNRRSGPISEIFAGSISRKVIRNSQIPVLLIPTEQ